MYGYNEAMKGMAYHTFIDDLKTSYLLISGCDDIIQEFT